MNKLAERLKALSDPTRLRIMRLLTYGELCVCDLVGGLDLPQPKVSRHMTYLKKSGWVTGRKSGKWVYYTLAKPQCEIQQNIINVLSANLPQLEQAKADEKRLALFLKNKRTSTCN
ncbi:MAG: ArsR/SmtB family transcription factor [Desulfovibrio sp.]